jgi:hypothetical protein
MYWRLRIRNTVWPLKFAMQLGVVAISSYLALQMFCGYTELLIQSHQCNSMYLSNWLWSLFSCKMVSSSPNVRRGKLAWNCPPVQSRGQGSSRYESPRSNEILHCFHQETGCFPGATKKNTTTCITTCQRPCNSAAICQQT